MKTQKLIDAHEHLSRKLIKSRVIKKSSNFFLKMESEFECGSYKIRGVETFFNLNKSMRNFEVLSAGNLALACALKAKECQVQCTALVPKEISSIKEEKLRAIGASIKKLEYSEIWNLALETDLVHEESFLHPLRNELLLGYGTIINELVNQVDDIEAIVIPYGIGGLALGVTRAIKAMNLDIEVYLCELENHSPFLEKRVGDPLMNSKGYTGFIEAMATPGVIPTVFDELNSVIKDVILVSEKDVKKCIRHIHLEENIIMEGAAGASMAAGTKLSKKIDGKVVSIITGKNIPYQIHRDIVDEN